MFFVLISRGSLLLKVLFKPLYAILHITSASHQLFKFGFKLVLVVNL